MPLHTYDQISNHDILGSDVAENLLCYEPDKGFCRQHVIQITTSKIVCIESLQKVSMEENVISQVRNDRESASAFFLWAGIQWNYSHSVREFSKSFSKLVLDGF